MRRTSILWTLVVCLVSLALAGCPKPLALSGLKDAPGLVTGQAAKPVAEPLVGRVAHLTYRTQATMGDIAVGATVSLIDTQTNITMASTLSDASGSFRLEGLTPTPNRTYYLEAIKGLPMGGAPNRAGFPTARVRTIVTYNASNGWKSLSANDIVLDSGTTALSAILSLRSALTPRPSEAAMLGSLTIGTPDVFAPGATNISTSEYTTVESLTATAIGTDNDPLEVISYDTVSQQYYLSQRGIVVTLVSPLRGGIGSVVRFEGSSLSNTPIVRFNGIQATSQTVNSVQTVALVRVPAGATSGPITLQVGSQIYAGPNFAVNNWDGHNVFDKAGNLYIADGNGSAVWRFAPDGTPTMVASSSLFAVPRSIAVDAWDNVYVSSYNSHKIYKVDPAGNISLYASGGPLNYPWGLAINAAGDLFVANSGGNNILKVATGSAVPITPTVYSSTGLSQPSRLAFDLAGYLYVSNWGNGTVSRVAPDATTVTLIGGFNSPGGVALDGLGNIYVGCYGNHAVYKITPDGQSQTFASLYNNDDSVAFHPDGTLYVASYYYQWVARLDTAGRVLNYYTPSHLTYSIKADTSNNLYVTSGQDYGKYAGTVVKHTWDAATGTYRSPKPLVTGLSDPCALAFAPNGDLYIGDWSGVIFKANATTGSYSGYLSGVGPVGDMTCDGSGNLYIASWGNRQVYKVVNGNIVKRWGTGTSYNANMIVGPDGAYYIPDYTGNAILRMKDGVMSVYCTNNGNGFGNPDACVFDSAGNLYVAGWGTGVVYKVASGSQTATSYVSGLKSAGALAVDASNNVYCLDYGNNALKKIAPGTPPTVTTLATLPASARGMVRNATTGDFFVTGTTDNAIYKVTAAGAVSNISTMPSAPWAITQDTNGDLYVACYGDGTIQRIPQTGGAPTLVTNAVGGPAGLVRDGTGTVICNWGSGMIYRVADGSNVARIIGDVFATPAGIVVDRSNSQYLYVADYTSGCLVKVDTVADTWTVVANSLDWSNGKSAMVGLAWGPDNMLYVQNWGGGVYKLNPALINPNDGTGVSFYGGNLPAAGLLGGIAFGPNGWLYGTSWSWISAGSAPLMALPPGGVASGSPAVRINNWPLQINY